MVEGVESIEPELDEQCLPYGKVLLQREIGVEEVGPNAVFRPTVPIWSSAG